MAHFALFLPFYVWKVYFEGVEQVTTKDKRMAPVTRKETKKNVRSNFCYRTDIAEENYSK